MNSFEETLNNINNINNNSSYSDIKSVIINLEKIKYTVANEINIINYNLLNKRIDAFDKIINNNNQSLKKILSSSNLTSQWIELSLGEEQIKLDAKKDLYKNIVSTIITLRGFYKDEKTI